MEIIGVGKEKGFHFCRKHFNFKHTNVVVPVASGPREKGMFS